MSIHTEDCMGCGECMTCRQELIERRRRAARQAFRRETERPAAKGRAYTFTPDGSPIGKCEDRRCNAHALLKDMRLMQRMKTIKLDNGEEQLIAIEQRLCPNCVDSLGSRGGKTYATPTVAPQAQAAPSPKPELTEFWRKRFGKHKALTSGELLGPSVEQQFWYRTVKRQG